MRRIAIADLEAAINRARASRPSSGPESALAAEVGTLAALYGRMIWARRESVEFDELDEAERTAVRAWFEPGAG